MSTRPKQPIIRHLCHLAAARATGQPPDAELVARFAATRDEGAFEALVRRHGPMVLAATRRVLACPEDAEDVFQATFLLLARKAGALRRAEAVGSWLYGVARRLSLHARTQIARQRRHEHAARPRAAGEPLTELTLREAQEIFDDELDRLAERYRLPLVLCCLEGLTRDEAARRLGWRVGAVKNRLERARELLRHRLSRRGLTVPAALGAVLLAETHTPAAVPIGLARRTVEAALPTGGAGVPPAVSVLAAELRATGTTKVMGVLMLCLVGIATAGALACRGTPDETATLSPGERQAAGVPAESNGDKRQPTDRFGDPLPAGALARLGTVRFRQGNFLTGFALSADNKRLVTVGGNPFTRLWDFATGREILHREGAQAVAFAPDGRTVVTKEQAFGNLHLWDPATGEDIAQTATGQHQTNVLVFSHDGRRLAAGGGGPAPVQVWRVHGRSLTLAWEHALHPGPWSVQALAFSPDDRTLACGYQEHGDVVLLDAATGKERRKLTGQKARVNALAFSPDGAVLATGGGDGDRSVHLWDAATGKLLHVLVTLPGAVHAVVFSPDGKRLACAGGTQTPVLALWDVRTRKQVRRLGDGHNEVVALAFTRDGRTLVAAAGGAVRLWDVQTGRECSPGGGHANFVCAARVSPDGRTAATAGGDRTIRLWDAATGRELRRLEGHSDEVRDVAFTPDGRGLASASSDGTVRLWDLTTGKEVRRMAAGQDEQHRRLVYSVAVSPDGRKLASGDYFGDCAHLWDVATGRELHRIPHRDGVMRVVFSPDGRMLATGEVFHKARFAEPTVPLVARICLWDVGTGRLVRQIAAHEYWIHALAFSPDGRLLASAGAGKYVCLWDVATGRKVWQQEGHQWGNDAVAFSPDGKTLAWGEFGGAIRLWEMATKRERRRFVGHPAAVHSLAFSSDGRALVSASMDTTALVWDVTGLRGGRTPMDPEAAWTALAGADAAKAYEAVWSLAASPGATVRMLRERLRPAPTATGRQLRRLVADLDDRHFVVREKATRDLARLGAVAEPAVRQALAGGPAPEARRRLERLLESVHGPVQASEVLRGLRSVEVLEDIGSAEARPVLATVAGGAPEALVTVEARAALRRLERAERP